MVKRGARKQRRAGGEREEGGRGKGGENGAENGGRESRGQGKEGERERRRRGWERAPVLKVRRWSTEYLHLVMKFTKWKHPSRNVPSRQLSLPVRMV